MKEIIEVPGEPQCHLRHVTHSDARELAGVVERNLASFNEGLGEWVFDANIHTMHERISAMLSLSSQEEGMAYCIIDGPSTAPGRIIGLNRLFNSPYQLPDRTETSAVHCGFWLEEFARGHGVIPRTSFALFQYAQERWGVDNIFMDIAQDNEASICCVRNMGAVAMRLAAMNLERLYFSPGWGFCKQTAVMDKWLMQLPEWQHPAQPQ